MTKINEAAQRMAKKRWRGIPEADRSALVPRNGGRPRQYPKCPRYSAHRFTNDRCPCGYERTN